MMSFSGLYTQGVRSTYDESALALYQRNKPSHGLPARPSRFKRTLFTHHSPLTGRQPDWKPQDLTEFLSAPNFSMRDWEGI